MARVVTLAAMLVLTLSALILGRIALKSRAALVAAAFSLCGILSTGVVVTTLVVVWRATRDDGQTPGARGMG